MGIALVNPSRGRQSRMQIKKRRLGRRVHPLHHPGGATPSSATARTAAASATTAATSWTPRPSPEPCSADAPRSDASQSLDTRQQDRRRRPGEQITPEYLDYALQGRAGDLGVTRLTDARGYGTRSQAATGSTARHRSAKPTSSKTGPALAARPAESRQDHRDGHGDLLRRPRRMRHPPGPRPRRLRRLHQPIPHRLRPPRPLAVHDRRRRHLGADEDPGIVRALLDSVTVEDVLDPGPGRGFTRSSSSYRRATDSRPELVRTRRTRGRPVTVGHPIRPAVPTVVDPGRLHREQAPDWPRSPSPQRHAIRATGPT